MRHEFKLSESKYRYAPVLYPQEEGRRAAESVTKACGAAALLGLPLGLADGKIGLFTFLFCGGTSVLAIVHRSFTPKPLEKPGLLPVMPIFNMSMLASAAVLLAGFIWGEGWWIFGGILMFVGGAALFAAYAETLPGPPPPPPPPKPMPYGDAHFATLDEVLAHGLVCPMAIAPTFLDPLPGGLQGTPRRLSATRASGGTYGV